MGEKLSWQEIEGKYDGEWVQLIDFDWPEQEPHPRAGIVRAHNSSYVGLFDEIDPLPRVAGAIVFVGRSRRAGANMIRTFHTQEIKDA